jgi:hypothetical protein
MSAAEDIFWSNHEKELHFPSEEWSYTLEVKALSYLLYYYES